MTTLHVSREIDNLSASPAPALDIMDFVDTRGPSWDRARNDAGGAMRQPSMSPEASRRKRLSLFNRSHPDDSKAEPPTVQPHATNRRHGGIAILTADSYETRPHLSRGRNLDSLRNSLFGGRKSANSSRPSSRSSQMSKKSYQNQQSHDAARMKTDLVPFAESLKTKQSVPRPEPSQSFESADEFYHHRKKSSISPPFNFQHVTHTARKHIAKLDIVDEKELKYKFRALNSSQKPKEQVRGIEVEDLAQHRERSLSPVARAVLPARLRRMSDASPSILQQTITRSLDETLFDETQETNFNPDDAYKSLDHVEHGDIYIPGPSSPKHCSSMSALSSSPVGPRLRNHSSFENSSARDEHSLRTRATTLATSSPPSDTPSLLLHRRIAGQSFREKAPLPPVPDQAERATTADPRALRTSGKTSPAPSTVSYSLFPAPPGTRMESFTSARSSKRSSKSTRPSSVSKSPESRKADVVSETSWEDDVDFAYEQAAEAVCDFDWERASRLQGIGEDEVLSSSNRTTSPDHAEKNGGVRLVAWMDQPTGPLHEAAKDGSIDRSGAHTSSAQSNDHKRGSSVGHRGFLAARSGSEHVITKNSPTLSMDTHAAISKTPPPKFSVTDSDMEACSYPSPYTSGTLHFPTFDSSIPEELSDPESPWPPGPRHRKSSSYGSFDSGARSLQTPSDGTRWSLASTSSMPDLVHGKRKSRSSGVRNRTSRPLASVKGSPDNKPEEPQDEDSLTVPSRDSILMRRPATPGDRQVLYSAGRTVQRGRSSTPHRNLLLARATPEEQKASDDAGWI